MQIYTVTFLIYIDRHIPHIYIYQLHNVIFYYFTEFFLNIDEEVLRDHWIPVAFMPICDPEKSTRLAQGYECDSARATRLSDNFLRHILGTWKDKTQNNRVVSLGNGSRYQIRSLKHRFWASDQQVHIVHIL